MRGATQFKMRLPTYEDVLRAGKQIAPYLLQTALHEYSALNNFIGARVFVKHENHQPTGAFKVRGGVNLISQLTEQERDVGVVAASTGNHGQSVAYAARLFGVKAVICAPTNANAAKTPTPIATLMNQRMPGGTFTTGGCDTTGVTGSLVGS